MELHKSLVTLELPKKGVGVVAMERIARGEKIATWFPHDRRTIDVVLESLDTLEARLLKICDFGDREALLRHSWPTPEGKVAVGARGSIFGCINHHSDPPTVLHKFSGSVWTTTANKAIADLDPDMMLVHVDYDDDLQEPEGSKWLAQVVEDRVRKGKVVVMVDSQTTKRWNDPNIQNLDCVS